MSINPKFVELSRKLRKDQTPWEKKLWMHLKNRKFFGLKFKRQVVLGFYIYDFECFEKKIIIELDGSKHKQPEQIQKDQKKQEFAEGLGYKVLRYNNNDIHNNLNGVLENLRLTIL
jgi:adenine-specific DNA-methyltransferase